MTSNFVAQARENYDPASVTELNGATQSAAFALDPSNMGASFDAVNRKITYLGLEIANLVPGVSGPPGHVINSTGFSLYNGSNIIYAPGATITISDGPQFSPQVFQKDIDTGVVTAFQTYSASATVPANVGFTYLSVSNKGNGNYTTASLTHSGGGGSGLSGVVLLDAGGSGYVVGAYITSWGSSYTSNGTFGISGDGTGAVLATSAFKTPSDGTYRWIGANFTIDNSSPNGPGLVNPRNGDYWTCAESCELYQYRKVDNFAQIIAPALLPSSSDPFTTPSIYPAGVDATWVYALSYPTSGFIARNDFLLVPAAIQSTETTAATKLPYVIWTSAPFGPDLGARLTFDTGGNLYFLSIGNNGSAKFHWRLTKYVPPTLGTFGSNSPGTMTDLTASLWNTSGPNTDGANYSFSHYTSYAGSLLFALCRLPATNGMACVLKMLKEASSSPTDYTKTLFSCLYVTFGGSPSYDYHSGFVTGYMNSSWVSVGSIPVTGWAVMDCREHDNYLEQSDHVYSGVDYTKRWFVFQCYPISASTVDTSNGLMDVFVQYQFVSGSPPVIITPAGISAPGILKDTDWSANYPAYQTAISQQYVVYNSTLFGDMGNAGYPFNIASGLVYEDVGLSPVSTRDGSFWYSGIAVNDAPGSPSGDAMFYLDSAFTSRAAYNSGTNGDYGPVSPPFLRLTFQSTNPPAFSHIPKGVVYMRKAFKAAAIPSWLPTAPSGARPIIYADFVNSRYWGNGNVTTLGTLLQHNAAWGNYDPSSVSASGLNVNATTGNPVLNNTFLGDIFAGCTIVYTYALTGSLSASTYSIEATAFSDALDYEASLVSAATGEATSKLTVEAWDGSAVTGPTTPNLSSMASAGTTTTNMVGSIDGASTIQAVPAGPPSPIPNNIGIGGTGGTGVYMTSIAVYPPQPNGDLPTLSSVAHTPQYPSLLNGYAARNPGTVQSVDVYTGCPLNITLKTPGVDVLPAGCSWNTSTHLLTNTLPGTTLDAWALGDGQIVDQAGDLRITRCTWTNGSRHYPFVNCLSSSTSLYVDQCTLDGNNLPTQIGGIICLAGTGANTVTVTNSWIKNGYDKGIFFGLNSPATVLATLNNNLFENIGAGAQFGEHCDVIFCFGTAAYTITQDGNTWLQNNPGYGTQGFVYTDNFAIPHIVSGESKNNTVVLNTVPNMGFGVNYVWRFDLTQLQGTFTVGPNWIDPTGLVAGLVSTSNGGGGPYNGTVTVTGNINMKTGAPIS